MKHVVFANSDFDFPISLEASEKYDKFTVKYGKDIVEYYYIAPAMEQLGRCLAHALELKGVVNP